MIDLGHKRQRSKCFALNLQPSVSHILTNLRSYLSFCSNQCYPPSPWVLNIKSFKLYYARMYEPFQNINSALFEVSVKDSSNARRASTQLSDYTPLLHVMYECMRGSYFSLPRRCPPEAVVKEECELSCWNNWPLSGTSWGQKGRNEGGKEAPSVAVRLRVEGRQASVSVILLTTASPSIQLIGIQSTVGSMGEYWWMGSGGGRLCLSQPSLPAGNRLGNQQARPTHCHW